MKKDEAYLRHILDEISKIEKFTESVTKKQFFENIEKQYAVLRALEIIGEATKNLSKEFRIKNQTVLLYPRKRKGRSFLNVLKLFNHFNGKNLRKFTQLGLKAKFCKILL